MKIQTLEKEDVIIKFAADSGDGIRGLTEHDDFSGGGAEGPKTLCQSVGLAWRPSPPGGNGDVQIANVNGDR